MEDGRWEVGPTDEAPFTCINKRMVNLSWIEIFKTNAEGLERSLAIYGRLPFRLPLRFIVTRRFRVYSNIDYRNSITYDSDTKFTRSALPWKESSSRNIRRNR